MPKYLKANATAKTGVNHVRTIVESEGCIFHKIEQDNDLGIDGIIEFIRDEKPLHRQVAVQIKSGKSYFDEKSGKCLIPVENHRDYWMKHPLPVIGIVFIPSKEEAYWVDIKAFLKADEDAKSICFSTKKINAFNKKSFADLFVSLALNEIPPLPFESATAFVESIHADEVQMGTLTLFRRYPNVTKTWDLLIKLFRNTPIQQLPPSLIYFLAHVPWHGDIWGVGEKLSEETRQYVRQEHFSKFGIPEVIKLLECVNDESGFSRGSIGQSVEAIISSLPDKSLLLKNICTDKNCSLVIRERAAFIYGMHEPKKAITILEELTREGSDYAPDLIECIRKTGGLYPYQ